MRAVVVTVAGGGALRPVGVVGMMAAHPFVHPSRDLGAGQPLIAC